MTYDPNVFGYVDGQPTYSRDEFIYKKRRRGPITDDAELVAFAEKVTSGWYNAGWHQTFTTYYLGDYALSEPLDSMTIKEYNRLKDLQKEARQEAEAAEAASSMKLSPEAVQRILDAFDNIIEAINRMIEWAAQAIRTLADFFGETLDNFILRRPRPSGATTPSMRSGPASARNTATASGGPSSLRWLRKEVGAREVQVRRLRALLECEHIPADPPRRLHLPAL